MCSWNFKNKNHVIYIMRALLSIVINSKGGYKSRATMGSFFICYVFVFWYIIIIRKIVEEVVCQDELIYKEPI